VLATFLDELLMDGRNFFKTFLRISYFFRNSVFGSDSLGVGFERIEESPPSFSESDTLTIFAKSLLTGVSNGGGLSKDDIYFGF